MSDNKKEKFLSQMMEKRKKENAVFLTKEEHWELINKVASFKESVVKKKTSKDFRVAASYDVIDIRGENILVKKPKKEWCTSHHCRCHESCTH